MNRQKNNQRGFSLLEAIIVLIAVGITAALMAAYFGANITHSAGPVNQFRASAQLNKIIETITSAYVYPYWSPSTEYIAGTIVIPTKSGRRTGLLYQAVQDGTSGPTEPDWSQAMTENSTLPDGTIVWRTVWRSDNDNNGAVPVLELKQWQPDRQYLAFGIDSVIAPGDGRQYVCISGGTSSISSEPEWMQGASAVTTEETGVQWRYVGLVPALVLKEAIGAEGTQPTSFYNIDVKYRVIQNRFIKFENGTEINIDSQQDDSEYGKYLKVVLGLHPDQKPRTDETVTALFVRQ
jgi:type II secretory pathway pseudopilin PulG